MDKKKWITELKGDIKERFKDNSDTDIYATIGEVVDLYVSKLQMTDILDILNQFDDTDFKELDKRLYAGVLAKSGLRAFLRVILYCVVEQEIFNDEELQKLLIP